MSGSAGFFNNYFLPHRELKGGRGGRWETQNKYGHPKDERGRRTNTVSIICILGEVNRGRDGNGMGQGGGGGRQWCVVVCNPETSAISYNVCCFIYSEGPYNIINPLFLRTKLIRLRFLTSWPQHWRHIIHLD